MIAGVSPSWGKTIYQGQVVTGQGNGFKFKESIFRLDNRKKVFTISVVKDWKRLLRDVVTSLEVSTARLDGAI